MASPELGFAKVGIQGEPFGSPQLKAARVLTCDLGPQNNNIQSGETNTRNQTATALSPIVTTDRGLTSELQFPHENDNWLHLCLESLFRRAMSHVDLAGGNAINCTFDAGAKTVTADSGNPFANAQEGAWLYFKSALNDYFSKVTAQTDTVLTIPGATVVGEIGVSTQIAGSYNESGNQLHALKAERRAGDHFLQFPEIVANQWDCSFAIRSVIQSNMSFIGGTVTSDNARQGTLGAAGNLKPITTGDRFLKAYLLRNGVSDPKLTLASFKFSVAPNYQEKGVLYQDGADGYDNGTFAVTGSLEVWASDKEYFDIAKSATAQEIGFAAQDVHGNTIIFEFPEMTWGMPNTPASGGTEGWKSTIDFTCASNDKPLIKIHFIPKLT